MAKLSRRSSAAEIRFFLLSVSQSFFLLLEGLFFVWRGEQMCGWPLLYVHFLFLYSVVEMYTQGISHNSVVIRYCIVDTVTEWKKFHN